GRPAGRAGAGRTGFFRTGGSDGPVARQRDAESDRRHRRGPHTGHATGWGASFAAGAAAGDAGAGVRRPRHGLVNHRRGHHFRDVPARRDGCAGADPGAAGCRGGRAHQHGVKSKVMTWTWFHRFGSPPYFYRFAGKWAPWFLAVATLLLLVGLYGALVSAPVDYYQSEVYRLIYVHV